KIPVSDYNARSSAANDAFVNDREFEGIIMQMRTQRLRDQLDRYGLPWPEGADWETEENTAPFYYRYLTREAYTRLSSRVAAAQRETQDKWLRWVPGITGVGGLIVAGIALVT